MKITVNQIVPHEDGGMEVHVHFVDESNQSQSTANVIVFIEKQDHHLSEIKNLAIQKALNFLSHIIHSEAKAQGV